MACHRLRVPLLAALALAAAVAVATPARGAGGIAPADGATIQARTDGSGYITSPATIDLVVHLDATDGDATVWVADSSDRTSAGLPAGTPVGSCAPGDLRAGPGDGTYSCSLPTILLRPGATYWWWVAYTRRAQGSSLAEPAVAGPYSFTLSAPGAPPAAGEPQSFVTAASAAHLIASPRWSGARSVEDTTLTRMLNRTMKARWKGPTHRVALACWTQSDFDALLNSTGRASSDGFFDVMGVWIPTAPHWVHLGATACNWAQRLIDTRAATARGAYGLVAALHETMHAYGIEGEAQANCYAVQLVPTAARMLGLPAKRAAYLGSLALRFTRDSAPGRYWDARRCRDGGAWDLDPRSKGL